VARELNLPLILSLHSTEHQRTDVDRMDDFSLSVCEWEKVAVRGAALVIVPHSSTRQQVISLYGASPEKVVIIPDVFIERPPGSPAGAAEAKRWFGLNQDAPMVFFPGEISHAPGADLLMDAVPTVCRNHRTAQFIFAGDGPLNGSKLSSAFRKFHECGVIELITTSATHAVLPLFAAQPRAVASQIATGLSYFESIFGFRPRGLWLPECDYYPGLDELLEKQGIRFFILESHGIEHADTNPFYGVYTPLYTPSGVAAFGRDRASTKQVWSAREGFPGDPVYR